MNHWTTWSLKFRFLATKQRLGEITQEEALGKFGGWWRCSGCWLWLTVWVPLSCMDSAARSWHTNCIWTKQLERKLPSSQPEVLQLVPSHPSKASVTFLWSEQATPASALFISWLMWVLWRRAAGAPKGLSMVMVHRVSPSHSQPPPKHMRGLSFPSPRS